MSDFTSRRGILRGLVSLPLVGGGVTLIGAPTAVALPGSRELLDAYDTFLFYERTRLNSERFGAAERWRDTDLSLERVRDALAYIRTDNAAMRFHGIEGFGSVGPSGRAAIVLSAVGVDWREDMACA